MKIKNVKVYGLEESIIRSGYPMKTGEPKNLQEGVQPFPKKDDYNRARRLANNSPGTGHNNFLKGIIVQFDLQYPEYFSPQLQRYHWIDIISSQSKMYKIMAKPLTVNDFELEISSSKIDCLNSYINENKFEELLNELPSGYLKWMGVSTNYLQLKLIYEQRKNHKLKEWKQFCDWIKTLPKSELIIG